MPREPGLLQSCPVAGEALPAALVEVSAWDYMKLAGFFKLL